MKWGPLLGGAAGLALSAWLLSSFGLHRIIGLIGHAGWLGILAVTAFHLTQVLCSALGWLNIAGNTHPRAGAGFFLRLRLIREAVNSLLPLAQIGGEVVVSRLLAQRGVNLASAIAGTVADLTLEMATQIAFTFAGLMLLLRNAGPTPMAAYLLGGLLIAAVLIAVLIAALRFGLTAAIERLLLRIGRHMGWAGIDKVKGLHDALLTCYRSPGGVARGALWHLGSWFLGGIEVWLGLHFLGIDAGLGDGIIIESLGQAFKALGFMVPGALGVQEGGYILICRTLGLSPEVAIALSLLKRLREVALGVPGLMVWQLTERQASLAKNAAAGSIR